MDRSWVHKNERRNLLKTDRHANDWKATRERVLGIIYSTLNEYEANQRAGYEGPHPYPNLPSLIFGSTNAVKRHLQAVIDWDCQMMKSESFLVDNDVQISRRPASDHLEDMRRPYNRMMNSYSMSHPGNFDIRHNNFLDGLIPPLTFSVTTAGPLGSVPLAEIVETAQAVQSAYMEYSKVVQESQWCYDFKKYADRTLPAEIAVFAGDSYFRDYFMAVHQQEAAHILKKYHGFCW